MIFLDRLPNNIKASVKCRLDKIKTIDGVEKVIIFGSFAKGTNTPSSDLDVAVFFNTEEPILIEQYRTLSKICTCSEIDIQVQAFSIVELINPCGIIEEIARYGLEYG
ncbi:MAG: nucleotidyltransferase domain-containing protein [Papillibacter sp.]|nr:nucleotidyltransferase domain-containing protein [Papillibacter sp.]